MWLACITVEAVKQKQGHNYFTTEEQEANISCCGFCDSEQADKLCTGPGMDACQLTVGSSFGPLQ